MSIFDGRRAAIEEEQKRVVAEAAAAEATRKHLPGARLSEADASCMKSFVEAKKELVETGRCAKSYRGPQGEPLCANKEVAWREFNYVYEQNVCKRTMKFQEQCGPTIEGLREIAPGERWDPLRDSCIKVY